MPPGEGQGRGRGRVSAGEGGGGRPAGSPASSSRAGGGACPRRLLPLGSAPALEARVRVGASKRVCSPSSSLSPVVRTGLGRRRLSGSLASRCGPSGWERRRSARAGRRRLRAPRSLRGALGFGQSATRGDDCLGPKEDSHAPPTPSPSQTRPPFSSHASASDPKVSTSNAPWPGGRPFCGFTVASAPTWEGSGKGCSTAHLPARPARELNGGTGRADVP
ncbi:uncharacterized protein LOC116572264 [Mustela erminea]|uniref:uncharacterized protein LOC116572264 n=1 Tax=Mustela erminea TaxID=36723 RepID=UPI0013870E2F|nr:uncharacterized protein LOC116572264 [Mustela erminea]